jgi:hypothetical protein
VYLTKCIHTFIYQYKIFIYTQQLLLFLSFFFFYIILLSFRFSSRIRRIRRASRLAANDPEHERLRLVNRSGQFCRLTILPRIAEAGGAS